MAKPSFGRHLVFKSGIHTNEGDQVWPASRVRGVLDVSKRLSPSRIPYTLLHPSDHLPIFGFADRDSLQLRELPSGEVGIDIMPLTFAEAAIPALKGRGLDKVSVGLGKDDEIVHLGLVPKPAVKGLGNVFSEAGEQASAGEMEVMFSSSELDHPVRAAFGSILRSSLQWKMSDIADWMRRMRERIIEQSSVEEADKQVPAYLIESIGSPLPDDEPSGDSVGNHFSDNSTQTDMDEETKNKLARLDALEAENASLKTQRDDAQRRAADLEDSESKRKIKVFLDGIADRVPGSMREQVEGILEDLKALKPRTFAAADGTTIEKSSFDLFRELLSAAKPVVVFGEVATYGVGANADGDDKRSLEDRAVEETSESLAKGSTR
jgi:hypothetical protein